MSDAKLHTTIRHKNELYMKDNDAHAKALCADEDFSASNIRRHLDAGNISGTDFEERAGDLEGAAARKKEQEDAAAAKAQAEQEAAEAAQAAAKAAAAAEAAAAEEETAPPVPGQAPLVPGGETGGE